MSQPAVVASSCGEHHSLSDVLPFAAIVLPAIVQAADMPQANRLTVHIMAAFAEHEAHAISERTKAALAALKARGVKLGNPRWRESLEKARKARIEQLSRPSEAVIDMIQRLRMEGATLRGIAGQLNALGLRTPRGAKWHATRVRAATRSSEPSTGGVRSTT